MNRREFLRFAGGVVVALPVGTFLVSCGEGDEYGTPGGDGPAAAPRQSGSQTIYTTSLVGQHSHTFALDTSALETPPAEGVSGATSIAGTHTHTVMISMAELANVAAGQTVKVTTGTADAHAHVLTLVKLSGTPTAGGDADGGAEPPPYTPPY